MEYKAVIGLEIHAELKTKTKMFCDCLNDIEERHPNVNICPVCTGHPGVLPTINQKAVEAVIKTGVALGGKIPKITKFDRKNYFYPDLPKGYQISQYDQPLVEGGALVIQDEEAGINKNIRIRRIHLEEDTARSIHDSEKDASLIDFNRSGIPLMELVTEPDIASAQEARLFAEELRTILRYLKVSGADMEKGEMRIEPNISVRLPNEEKLPDWKVELKNINSFRAVEAASRHEIDRQIKALTAGKKLAQETRGWREDKGVSESQRSKEEAHDYRYFPEPDLPVIETARLDLERIRSEIPELPNQKLERFKKELGLSWAQAHLLTRERETADFFEASASELKTDIDEITVLGPAPEEKYRQALASLYNYFTSDLRGIMKEAGEEFGSLKILPSHLADLVAMIIKGEISSRIAKDVLREMHQTGGDPHEIIKDTGLAQISDETQIEEAAKKVVEANPAAVSDYKKGKANALQFLIGKSMGELKGRGSPEKIRVALTRLLQ